NQGIDHGNLVRNLCAAQNRYKRMPGIVNYSPEIVELLFHQETGGRLFYKFGDPRGGSMRAVGRSEGIVDVKIITQRCELFRKRLIVLFFFWMKTKILKQQNLAVLQTIRF